MSEVPKYDGTSDPQEHITTYTTAVKGNDLAPHEESNDEAMPINLELLEGCRDLAYVIMAAQKQRIERYYNRKDNFHFFKVGDLVLRKLTLKTRDLNMGKLGPTWEGPYRISAVIGKGSYELENQNGDKLPSNWNV
ncbi:uncharacterized protein [Nicotiana tomentosiformis]|uniref:uncharacterized protein n=1 Tax=Nicotiana tomentosiformis TaxID=4098 RepID=UPI00388CB12F